MFSLPIPTPRDAIVAIAVAGLCLPLGYCKGSSAEKARQESARAVANVKSLQRNASAVEIAANERITDAALNSTQTKELLDAVSSTPTSRPDTARVALGCQQLRQSGRSEASLPSVCRPAK